ncbi:hypothetical protein [Serratia rubidaea]|nr:hypothetical protein [Serratia rubidaea]MDC6108835.1 hypothetical protein [Serratia rubidaea]
MDALWPLQLPAMADYNVENRRRSTDLWKIVRTAGEEQGAMRPGD